VAGPASTAAASIRSRSTRASCARRARGSASGRRVEIGQRPPLGHGDAERRERARVGRVAAAVAVEQGEPPATRESPPSDRRPPPASARPRGPRSPPGPRRRWARRRSSRRRTVAADRTSRGGPDRRGLVDAQLDDVGGSRSGGSGPGRLARGARPPCTRWPAPSPARAAAPPRRAARRRPRSRGEEQRGAPRSSASLTASPRAALHSTRDARSTVVAWALRAVSTTSSKIRSSCQPTWIVRWTGRNPPSPARASPLRHRRARSRTRRRRG